MRRCHLEPDLMLVVHRGEVVQDDLVLQPGDQIRLVPAILGG
jgi:sulfur carrier protein ThiS